tara:strand:- start:8043 stop:8933 length:891 start_codon:yes stop_codon:yes gene_type:complete
MNIETQEISSELFTNKRVRVFIKRLDKITSNISGNKYFKLKYNLELARKKRLGTLLTFGGAYSNNILSLSIAGKDYGFNTIGVIRGDEIKPLNSTLSNSINNGMKLHYVNRSKYRNKYQEIFINNLKDEFGDFYLIPEGGTNYLAIEGTTEILTDEDDVYDYICCPIGTGGTISGVINSSNYNQNILGFSSIKGMSQLHYDVNKWCNKYNWKLMDEYSFGGYAKISKDLVDFINRFYFDYLIPLDIVYTGKMLYGVIDLIKKNYFHKSSNILVLHTGGLQGNIGMNNRYNLNLPVL